MFTQVCCEKDGYEFYQVGFFNVVARLASR